MRNKLYGTTFYGNEASDYAKEQGYLDYSTLAKAFYAVLNNNIKEELEGMGYYWEQESGMVDNSDEIEELNEELDELNEKLEELDEQRSEIEDDVEFEKLGNEIKELENQISELEDKISDLENEQNYPDEIFQYFIISDNGAEILKNLTNEIVFYNESLDMYIWGVTHYGTSWSYVLTDIKLNCGEEAYK